MVSTITRLGMICIGVVLIVASIRQNSLKRILVNHAVMWSLLGVVAILAGAAPVLSSWTGLMAPGTVVVLFAAGILFLVTEFRNSLALSQLTTQNRELAMQTALLNQEYEELLASLSVCRARAESDEANTGESNVVLAADE